MTSPDIDQYSCEVSIKDSRGKTIYQATTTNAKAGVILSGLNIAKQRFVEWLEKHESREDHGRG